jgi:glycosyltransferase involved in cell wall biosynthesis
VLKTSAVMITGKTPAHERWARVAIRCFLEQTYPAESRELLIVNDGPYRLCDGGEPKDSTGRPLVRETILPHGGTTLGELRNLAIDQAWGDAIIQWDDDDWHGPERVAVQAAPFAQNSKTICTFLRRQLRYSFPLNRARVHTWDRIHGTVMHRKTDIRYPARRRAEDTVFLDRHIAAFGNRALFTVDDPAVDCDRLYIRFHHSDEENTWPARHIMGLVPEPRGRWNIKPAQVERLRTVLRDYYGVDTGPGVKPSEFHPPI